MHSIALLQFATAPLFFVVPGTYRELVVPSDGNNANQ